MRVGPGTFNGVSAGAVGVSTPQPDFLPPTAALTILDGISRDNNFGPCRNGNPCIIGDPINVSTGNVYEHREDLFITGRGLSLSLERSYNSQDNYQGPLGYGWTHTYNTNLKTNPDGSVTWMDHSGARLTFTRNADGSYSAPKGIYDRLTRNADGSYTLRNKDGVEWRFGASGKLQKIADPNGNAITLAYDTAGRLAEITNTVGRKTNFSYDGAGRISTITDPAGRTVRYIYSSAGDLVSVTDPLGQARTYEYDATHNMTATVDPPDPGAPAGATGHRTTFVYDAQDRATSSYGENNADKVEVAYGIRKTHVKDSKGDRSTFTYDNDGHVIRILDPYGNAISYTWDGAGNMTSETDALGNKITMKYDAAGNLTSMTKTPTGGTATTTAYTYNAAERMTKASATTFAYDKNGNMVSSTAGATTTSYGYDFNDLMTKAGARTYKRDALGRAISSTSGTTTTDYVFDGEEVIQQQAGTSTPIYYARGYDERIVNRRSGAGTPTYYHHDATGSVTGLSTAADALTNTYDAFGNWNCNGLMDTFSL